MMAKVVLNRHHPANAEPVFKHSEFQRLFATAIEKQIWLHRHILS
jgi:hypothetical protein